MAEPTPTPIASNGRVPPAVALALLESLRAIDTPPEEPEQHDDLPDLASALPHRLGLSAAVEDQIHRYREQKSDLPVQEVASLVGLIGRRPDAGAVFAEAGRRLARRDLDERPLASRLSSAAFPERTRHRLALRRVRRIARRLNPGGEVHTERKPPALIVRRCLVAHAAGGEAGCALLTGAMELVLQAYGADGVDVTHPFCEARSDGPCVWKLQAQPG